MRRTVKEDEDRHPSGSDERHVKLRVHGAVRVIVNWMIFDRTARGFFSDCIRGVCSLVLEVMQGIPPRRYHGEETQQERNGCQPPHATHNMRMGETSCQLIAVLDL